MDKKLNLYAPCANSWDKMEAAGQNRFCRQCNKEVVDFTSMTDEQVISYFKQHTNVCGRILPSQLGINLTEKKPNRSLPYLTKRVAALLLAFLTFKGVSAKTNKKKADTVQLSTGEKRAVEDSTKIIVSVNANHGIPISGAEIFFNNIRIGVTDSSGILRFSPVVIDLNKSYTIAVSHPDYDYTAQSYHSAMGSTSYHIILSSKAYQSFLMGAIHPDDLLPVDLSNLKYDYRKPGMTDEQKVLLGTLGTILRNRPDILLEISGCAKGTKNLSRLKEFQKKIKDFLIDKEGIQEDRFKITIADYLPGKDGIIEFSSFIGDY